MNQNNTANFKETCIKYAKLLGIPLTAFMAMLITSPLLARMVRSACYWGYGNPSWTEPWAYGMSTIACENLGDASFHWYDTISWISNNLPTAAAAIGTSGAFGYWWHKMAQPQQEKEDDTFVDVESHGYYPSQPGETPGQTSQAEKNSIQRRLKL